MAFSLKVGDASVLNLNRFWYEQTLNGIRTFEIVTDANDSTLRSEYSVDKTTEIYKDGTLDFKGIVKKTESFQAGGIIMSGLGQEIELAEEKCPVDSGKNTKTWNSTSSNTIFNTLVTTVSGWSADTSGAASVTLDSFRVSKSMSVWVGIINLLKHINKDIYINDSTKTVYLTDKKNRTEKAAFNEGINCGQVRWTEESVKATKVEVYGKGDGNNQITGSAGSGTPIHEVIDRNILTTTEANTRAQKELDLILNAVKHYFFDAHNPNEDVELGDTIKLNASSAGLHDTGIDIVRFTRGMVRDSETLTIEVTNTQHRIASKVLYEEIARSESEAITARSSMQGSGNTQSWARGINAKLDTPLVVPFYVASDFVTDEADNIRIESLKLDYDVDPYRKGVGSSSETQKEPSFAAVSAAASHGHSPYETGSGHDHANPATTSGVVLNTQGDITGDYATETELNLTSDAWNTIEVFSNANIAQYDALNVHVDIDDDSGSVMEVYVRVELGSGDYYPNTTGVKVRVQPDCCASCDIRVPVQAFNVSSGYLEVEAKPNDTGCDTNVCLWWDKSHKHNIGTYDTADTVASLDDANQAPAVTGKTVLHAHDVTVGDDISDATSINASEVDIYLDYHEDKAITNNETAGADVVIEMTDTGNISVGDVVYFNGTNKEWATVSAVSANTSITATIAANKSAGDKISWVNKHSILNTGKTIDHGVDITDSDSYPDATGFWRVRINPDHATPDLVQGIIRMKFAMDN